MTRRRLWAVLLALVLSAGLSGCLLLDRGEGDPVGVRIGDAEVRGLTADGVRSFRGIPYAQPPVGDLRWRPPLPVEGAGDELDATDFGARCLQPGEGGVLEGSSEDCLHLNVWRPDTDAEDLPVMVWIHGGGLTAGNGDLTDQLVRGTVADDVVLVSLNYRLGRLGYLAHPALAAEQDEAGDDRIANFGLLDQVAALEWVQDNIEQFGGDPDQVTVFGISAGGASVNFLMSSPLGEGLFARAVTGSGLGGELTPTYDEAAAAGTELFAEIDVSPRASAAALRGVPAEEVAQLPAFQLLNQMPILDDALPASVSDTFADGDELAVPWIVGATDRELLDAGWAMLGVDPGAVRRQLATGFEAPLLAAYGDVPSFDAHFLNDMVFTQPATVLAEQHAERAPTFLYRFGITSEERRATNDGAVHGTDYSYVFGDVEGDPDTPGSAELAEQVGECWTSFAATGRPSCGVEWPEADGGAMLEFTLDGPRVVEDDPWEERFEVVGEIRTRLAAAAGR